MLEIRHVMALWVLGSGIGCTAGADKPPAEDRFAGPVEGAKADHESIGLVGSLSFGQTAPAVSHDYPPRYLAYAFQAGGGDRLDVRVRSLSGGDPVTWILDGSGAVIGSNDDESSQSLDSRVQLTVPAGAAATHYVVFRDYADEPGVFQVRLLGVQDLVSCQVDADCARVEAGCCQLGDYVAVRADRVADHLASLGCTGEEVCPPPPAEDHGETALCDNNSKTCEILLPDEIQCGGFRINPHFCPDGYACVGDALMYDGTGECAQECAGPDGAACPAGQSCGVHPQLGCGAPGVGCPGLCTGD